MGLQSVIDIFSIKEREPEMKKQPSLITVAKVSTGYRVDARGAFGGGWSGVYPESELASRITVAWQQYGSNSAGCQIIGDMPPDVRRLADELMESGERDVVVITIRLPDHEAKAIRKAAAGDTRSVNQWCRIALVKAAKKEAL